MADDTPVMMQYKRIKSQHPDSILFFRLGDFYEMFENDAREVSGILDIVLTKRHNIPMCGIPYHAATSYIARLLKAGKKIAICEQLSSIPPKGSKIVEREVVEIITPGTITDEDYLDNKTNNYLAAIGLFREYISLSYVDISTGEFAAIAFNEKNSADNLSKELLKLNPSEIIIQESLSVKDAAIKKLLSDYSRTVINRYPDWYFNISNSEQIIKNHFNITTLKGFGFEPDSPEILSAGVLLEYLCENSGTLVPHITGIEKKNLDDSLNMDEKTLKNLEILKNLNDSSSAYTLLSVIDRTKTSMGGRMIKKWVMTPSCSKKTIEERLDCVDFFYKNQLLLTSIRSELSGLNDIERFSSRLALDKINAKDFLGLKNTAASLINIFEILKENRGEKFFPFAGSSTVHDKLHSLRDFLDKSIYEDPPVLLTDGNLIKAGYNSELDKLRDMRDNSQNILNNYIEEEKVKSSIPNLRIRYNKIIGYFLEITKSQIDNIPDYFIRRQSLVGSERYTTETLIALETELNNASEKIVTLEKDLFTEIRNNLKGSIPFLRELAFNISSTDCFQSFAHAATVNGYTRPSVNESKIINIKNGRHPVVEAYLPYGEYIPNNILLGNKKQFILLTGPNMAGKSTFLRQTALIVLLAQAGSFVPADDAQIGLVDKIFCRVGASDNLARGESTFLVEMAETSNILRTATEKSLIIMDEVGRGTGTKDGLAIAWSICEYLINKIRAKTLFATHYHELVKLDMPDIENLSMNAMETEGQLVFLKKVKHGPANKSYGINVAEIAGIPYEVIIRAKELMLNLEKDENTVHESFGKLSSQNELFSSEYIILNEISGININNLTPLEALNLINTWHNKMKQSTDKSS